MCQKEKDYIKKVILPRYFYGGKSISNSIGNVIKFIKRIVNNTMVCAINGFPNAIANRDMEKAAITACVTSCSHFLSSTVLRKNHCY